MERTIFFIVISVVLIQIMVPRSTSCCSSCQTSTFRHFKEILQTNAVQNLLKRLLPTRYEEFLIDVDFSLGKKDVFQIESRDNITYITGNRGYSAALGLQYYLKYYCGAHISWSGNQLNLPLILPKVSSPEKVFLNDKYRYYMNVCTLSYSTVWWNWERWEKEIDWMALNGINLPLAFTGQEFIWKKVFKAFNFTDHDTDEFFTGPAFLAWNRMGNVQGWAGPLTDNWLDQKKVLQRRILRRMRSFGMTPVLPAFSGRVPPSIQRLYPNASYTYLEKQWGHFNQPYSPVTFLQPTDPLFKKMGKMFLRYYIKEFGTNHIYNTDLFNEMPPPSTDPRYLRNCGKFVYRTMAAVDRRAKWLLQGWMFVNDETTWTPEAAKALLTSVPIGRMIVLDLQAEFTPQYVRLNSFYGQPFIWCIVQNYGGVSGLYGSLESINTGPFIGRTFANSTMIGTGIAPEGIETNDIVYELMNEMAWRKSPADLDEWMIHFAERRYGIASLEIKTAVLLLLRSVYNATADYRNHGKYILTTRPSLKLEPFVWYDSKDVLEAWKLFVNASQNTILQNSKLFKHDLVDLTRQGLQLAMDEFYNHLLQAYFTKDVPSFMNVSKLVLGLYEDLETLLSTDVQFLIGPFLKAASFWAKTPLEKKQYEYNARNQITLWGPSGEILDYANKQWTGIITKYHQKRWKLLVKYLEDYLIYSYPFNQARYNSRVLDEVGIPFTLEDQDYPVEPQGDPIKTSENLLQKYMDLLQYIRDKEMQEPSLLLKQLKFHHRKRNKHLD